jgi:adenylate cyclase
VVASNSTFAYKDNQENVEKISKELGVAFLLKGSIQKHLDNIRLNIHLIDVRNSNSIWAERYNRQLTDIFQIQDELASKIVTALKVKLAPEDQKHLTRNYIVNIDAYDHFLRGLDHYNRRTKADNQQAQQEFSKAIELDPGYARAYATLALSYSIDVLYGWNESDKELLLKASDLVDKAILVDATIPQVYFVKGHIELYKRNYEYAAQQVEKAISIEPNYADGYALLAWILHYAGKSEEGLEVMQRAVNLNPHIPSTYLLIRGALYYSQEQIEKALADFEKAVQINPRFQLPRVWLAASYVANGQIDKAQWEVEEVLSLKPDLSIQYVTRAYPIQDSVYLERFLNHLREAGLPE